MISIFYCKTNNKNSHNKFENKIPFFDFIRKNIELKECILFLNLENIINVI